MHNVDALERLDLRQVQAEGFERTFELPFRAIRDFSPRLLPAHMQIPRIRILRPPAMNLDFNFLG